MSTEHIIDDSARHDSEMDYFKETNSIITDSRSSVESSSSILNNSVDKKGKCSSFSTFINIVCVAVGVGSLQLAYTLKQSGWFGIVFIVFSAALSFVTAALTIKCIYLKPGGGRIEGYHDIGFEAFGKPGYYTIAVFNIVNIVGSVGIYAILSANNISHLLSQVNIHVSSRVLMIATSAIMCVPTLFAKTLGETLFVSLIGTATSAIVTVVVVVMACVYPIRNGEMRVGDTSLHKGHVSHSGVVPGGFAMALMSASFAYLNTTIVPHLEGGMRRPQMFNRVFMASLAVIVAIYLAMATTGYAAYGDQTKSPVTLNFPNLWPTTLATVSITIHVMFAGPLFLVQMALEVEHGLNIDRKGKNKERIWRVCIRIASALTILAISEALPFFEDVISLVSALTNPVLIYLTPIACYVKLNGWRNCSKLSLGLLGLLLVFGILVSVVGLVETIEDIMHAYKGTK